jgi:hypothetical protein
VREMKRRHMTRCIAEQPENHSVTRHEVLLLEEFEREIDGRRRVG